MWKTVKLEDVADVSAGNPAPKKDLLSSDGALPFVRTSDVGQIRFGIIGYARDRINEDNAAGLSLKKKGTILFPKSGASTFLNHRVMLGVDAYVASHLATIKANEADIQNTFLLYLLSMIRAQDLVQDHDYPSLRLSDLKGLEIPLPPLEEQKRIVAILDEAFAGIDQAIANTEQNIQNARELFESYLNTIFTQKGEGWEKKELSEICDVRDGTHDSPKYVEKGIPFVTQKNIRLDGLCFKKTKFISSVDHEKFYKRSNVAKGDILISMIGANRGMACIVDDDRVFSIKNVGLIKEAKEINQLYLLYYLKSSQAKAYVEQESRGGAQPFIGLTKLRSFPVPLAPLVEQSELVQKLKALDHQASMLDSVYQQKLSALKELKQSLLQKAFAGELTSDLSEAA